MLLNKQTPAGLLSELVRFKILLRGENVSDQEDGDNMQVTFWCLQLLSGLIFTKMAFLY